MSNYSISLSLVSQDIGIPIGVSEQFTTFEAAATMGSIVSLDSEDETLPVGDIITPRLALVKNLSSNNIMIGFDGSTYPQWLPEGAFTLIRLNYQTKRETQTVQTVADTADSLGGTYFVVTDKNGESWAIGVGTLTHAEDHEIATALLTDGSAADVASALYDALAASDSFTALFEVEYDATTDDDLITIRDRHAGTRTDIADTGSTGFTLATTQQGAASEAIHAKAETGTAQALVAVIPV